MTITLPLPPRELSPNARVHWAAKARAVKAYRAVAYWEAMMAVPRRDRMEWKEATAHVVYYKASARKMDADNILASLKASFDGLVDAGILADDAGLRHAPVRLVIDRANPRVEITIVNDNAGV
jgi:crossover junction endodeoxyribonuclease RusA